MANAALLQSLLGSQKPKDLYTSMLIKQGLSSEPVGHWTQGASRIVQALLGAQALRDDEQQSEAALQTRMNAPGLGDGGPAPAPPPGMIPRLAQTLMGGQPQPEQPPPQPNLGPVTSGQRPPNAPPARMPREHIGGMPIYSQGEVNPMDVAGAGYGNAIASIESGGRYNLQGPVTNSGDRAYGRHQVMGANVPSFTREATGTAATPQQFLANPDLQESTFNSKFAEYINRFGSPEAAARAWFAGPGGMNDPSRRDQLGTTVGQYGQRFAQAAGVPQGGQARAQVEIPPEIAAHIRQLYASRNPANIAQADALYQQYAKPREPKDQVVGDQLVRINPDGSIQTLHDATKKTDDERNLDRENRDRAARRLPPLTLSEYRQQIKAAEKAGTEEGEARANLESIASKMPGLESVVKQLDALSNAATYTWTGRATDAVRRQLEMEPRNSAVARQQYISMVDNQILPLLRETFGAQFTAKEGETLRATLGNPDLHPQEKQAVLKAFIEQKRRDVEALARRTGVAPPPPSSGGVGAAPEATRSIGGKTYVKINGQWFEQ